jgi:hypothetical protein
MQPLLQWKSNENYTNCVCVCSLRYTACNAHAPYFHLWPAPPYNIFPLYLLNVRICGKPLLIIQCLLWISLQLLPEISLIIRRTERDVIINVHRSSIKVGDILVRLQWNLKFVNRFSKNTQISSFMKIRPVGEQLYHADGRTDKTNLIVAFRNFANAPKKGSILYVTYQVLHNAYYQIYQYPSNRYTVQIYSPSRSITNLLTEYWGFFLFFHIHTVQHLDIVKVPLFTNWGTIEWS